LSLAVRIGAINSLKTIHVSFAAASCSGRYLHRKVYQEHLGHCPDVLDNPSNARYCPLYEAVATGNACIFAEFTRWLLCHGAHVNLANDLGELPLHLAAWQGHAEVCKLLTSACYFALQLPSGVGVLPREMGYIG